MKLRCLLWHWGRRGGGPLYTLELGRALRRRGNVDVWLSLSRQADVYPIARAENLAGYCPDTYTGTMSALASITRVPAIARNLGKWLAAEKIGTVVSTMQSLWNPIMLRTVCDGQRQFYSVIHDAATHHGDWHPGRKAAQARELRAATAVISLTRHVALDITRGYGYPYQRIHIIPHGVFSFSKDSLRERQFPQGRPFRFLLFGRLLAYKGLDLLADAIDLLASGMALEVQISGSGPDSAILQRLAAHPLVTLDNRWIPEDEMPSLLGAADAILAPYTGASQSGVIAAAYGAGLPVIATPVGGLAEQIEPFGSGLVSADTSARSFARAMTKLAGDAALYDRLSGAAVTAAKGPLSWDAIAQSFERLVLTQETSQP